MMRENVTNYLKIERDIEKLNEQLRLKKQERQRLGLNIIKFCQSQSKDRISLPDGSQLRLYNNKTYQNLSYSMIEKILKEYNQITNANISVEKFIAYLKSQRNSKTNLEMKYFKS